MRRKGKDIIHKVIRLLFILREYVFKVRRRFGKEYQSFEGKVFFNRDLELRKMEVLKSARFKGTGIGAIPIQPREGEVW